VSIRWLNSKNSRGKAALSPGPVGPSPTRTDESVGISGGVTGGRPSCRAGLTGVDTRLLPDLGVLVVRLHTLHAILVPLAMLPDDGLGEGGLDLRRRALRAVFSHLLHLSSIMAELPLRHLRIRRPAFALACSRKSRPHVTSLAVTRTRHFPPFSTV